MATSQVDERRTSRDTEPAPAAPPAPKVEIVVSVPTVAKALAILFGLVLVVVARDAILSILLSAVMVLGLDPPVSAVERRGWGRGKAALAVFAAIAATLFVIVVWAVVPVWNEITQLVAKLPSTSRSSATARC